MDRRQIISVGVMGAALWCAALAVAQTTPAAETFSDAEILLAEAAAHLAAGHTADAVALLDAVIEGYGEARVQAADGRITRAARKAQQMIAAHAEALGVYRLRADSKAHVLLGAKAAPCTDLRALRQVYDRYFMTTHGDEAALTLATRLLDRHDFLGARRVLRRVIAEYPDPSVPLADVHLKLALASLRVGDRATASRTAAKLDAMGHPHRAALLRKAITESAEARRHGEEIEWSARAGQTNSPPCLCASAPFVIHPLDPSHSQTSEHAS
jgi:tetratricopeptide (TPR) repeat protein